MSRDSERLKEKARDLPYGPIAAGVFSPAGGFSSGLLGAMVGAIHQKATTRLPTSIIVASNALAGVSAGVLSAMLPRATQRLLTHIAAQDPARATYTWAAIDKIRALKAASPLMEGLLNSKLGIGVVAGLTFGAVHDLIERQLSAGWRRTQVLTHNASMLGNRRLDVDKESDPITARSPTVMDRLHVKQMISYVSNVNPNEERVTFS